MNKKGFTLVEVIVSLALLSLIGVAVGISLNKIFKNQEVKNYDEYVEKVKSSALLYANNTVDIINKLNSNYSYTVVTIKELVDKGYINKNLTNPETKEKINQEDSVRIYYNEDYEMIIEYPYTEKDEVYLYTMNYSVTYKSNETGLCYKGLNGPTLQLVNDTENEEGNQVRKLSIDNNEIVAYMEDGSECKDSKIDTKEIGTYKIRYEYTIDGTDVNKATNKKIAERTITVKPSKPEIIENFKVINDDSPLYLNAYKAQISFGASDVVKMQYCIVATKADDVGSITSCKDTSNDFKANTWIDLENGKKISLTNIDIAKLFEDLKYENEIRIFLYIKNEFEEYTMSENQAKNLNGTTTYLLTNTLILHLDTNEEFTTERKFYSSFDDKGNMIDEINESPIIKRNILNKINNSDRTKFKDVMSNSKITAATESYYLEGWYRDENLTKKIKDEAEIFKVIDVYAKWVKDDKAPTCRINPGGTLKVTTNDNYCVAGENWVKGNNAYSYGLHKYEVKDCAGNVNYCGIDIMETEPYSVDCNCGYTDTCHDDTDGCYGRYDGCTYPCKWKCETCHETRCAKSGYEKYNEKCYKRTN